MFLTLDEWVHPSGVIQALAQPATAWNCIAMDGILPSVLVEFQELEDGIHVGSRWLMLGDLEVLASHFVNSDERVGSVYVLLLEISQWVLKSINALRRCTADGQSWLEYLDAAGIWHSATPLPLPERVTVDEVWRLGHTRS
ncbi:hypothetical protein [Cupriavidus pauculus]|uniref:hypothetical protein n=1 Tax=Cupriavidus pauculus TaxID=82633 RepID=UPI0038579A55